MAVALAFAAAVAGVVGAWELLAAVERSRRRGARRAARRAGRAGRPRGRVADDGRAAAARRCSRRPCSPRPGGCSAGAVAALLAGVAGPAIATALVRARRRRFRHALAASAPVVARALADALVRRALGARRARRRRGQRARRRGPRAARGGARAAARRAHRVDARAPAPPRRLAGLGRDRRRHPAPARRRRRPAGAAARPRRRARGRVAPGPRRGRRHRPGALHRADRARRSRSAPRCSPSSPSPGCSRACSATRSRPG